MKKLASIEQLLSEDELLSQIEITEINGGRRYVTRVYSMAMQVLSLLRSYGIRTHMAKHNDNYCIEW